MAKGFSGNAFFRFVLVTAMGIALRPAMFAQVKPETKPATLVARVITMPIMDLHLVGSKNETSLVFATEPAGGKQGSAHFVLVYYDYSSDKKALPDSFFDYSIRYELRVTRDPGCDSPVSDIRSEEIHREGVTGLAAELMPARSSPYWGDKFPPWDTKAPLACYRLRPGRYKVAR